MIKKLRKSQKIILLIALIISFCFLVHPEYGSWIERLGRYDVTGGYWLWEDRPTSGWSIVYSKMILKIFITCIGTVIVLFIESLIYSNKEED